VRLIFAQNLKTN